MVPGAGIEPARLAAGDFESPASTNFTTRAGMEGIADKSGIIPIFFFLRHSHAPAHKKSSFTCQFPTFPLENPPCVPTTIGYEGEIAVKPAVLPHFSPFPIQFNEKLP